RRSASESTRAGACRTTGRSSRPISTDSGGSRESGRALERALELVQMVVVVPRHQRDEVVDRDGTAAGVHAGALPLLGGQRAEQRERLVAARAKRQIGRASCRES